MRKALIVGIDHYDHVGGLGGCVNDAHSVKSVLERHADGTVNFATPKLLTGTSATDRVEKGQLKDAVRELFADDSEIALFYFAGHGYIEDTGLPRILRDVHVTPIWEGTTNVLSLELLRGMGDTGDGLRVVAEEIVRRTKTAPPALADEACLARAGVEAAMTWATGTTARGGRPALEAGARGLLLTLGRALSLGLLIEQATWAAAKGDSRPTAIARRYASLGVDRLNRRPAAADVLA